MTRTPKPYVVGLTGGIGSGKSTVAEMFQRLGAAVIDADAAAREVVQPGSSALDAISQHFGEDFIDADGGLRRAELRRHIFADPEAKAWLEGLLHPLIHDVIKEHLGRSSDRASTYHLLVSPLLLETDQHKLVQRILVVDADRQTQLQRTLNRDGSDPATINAIIDAQMDREKRLQQADDVIDNSGGQDTLQTKVEQLHHRYVTLARDANRSP